MTIRDGDWTLLSWDQTTGRSVWTYFDGQDTHVRTIYPVENDMKFNREMFNTASSGWKADWHHVASIPNNIFYDSGMNEANRQGDEAFQRRWLNSSDNRAWRVKPGSM